MLVNLIVGRLTSLLVKPCLPIVVATPLVPMTLPVALLKSLRTHL